MNQTISKANREGDAITLFLCGDVMTGRGIDQVLPNPSDARIFEPYMTSATGYVELAENIHGSLPRPIPFEYIWGDALREFERVRPDVKLINLETSITKSNDYWRGKGINYRMSPANIPCITVAGIDCCALANNHVLDWGYSGLNETLETLRQVNIKYAGAGENLTMAQAPAIMEVTGKGRVLVFSFGSHTSGIPWDWGAGQHKPGVNLLNDCSEATARRIAAQVQRVKRSRDIVVASIHWGGNWGYAIPREQMRFAHSLVDVAGIDLVHGHSSHHPKGIEVYKDKLILYGCGDFLDDYEGISGYEGYRDDLSLMYFAHVEPATGELKRLEMTPTQIKRFKVNYASESDALWLASMLNEQGVRFGNGVEADRKRSLNLRWGK